MTTIAATVTVENFEIERGRTETILVTVEGVEDWTDLLARLQANVTLDDDTPSIVLEGRIYPTTNQISFAFAVIDTNTLTVSNLRYEIVIYKADKTFVRNSTRGIIKLVGVVREDPTL